MVTLKEIRKDDVLELIVISYEDDIDLLKRYHVGNFSLFEACESTFEMIEITEKKMSLSYFEVYFENKPIGYVITSGNHLYSFGINIKYRTKEILSEWWWEVKKILGESFTCLLFSNNTRAINYLKNRGMKIEWENTENKELNEVFLKY